MAMTTVRGKEQKYITAQDIISAIPHQIVDTNRNLIEKACAFAKEKHEGQLRYSKVPYYTHVFEVGKLLAQFGMPTNVIVAGILHDTIEDTKTTAKEIAQEFNEEISFLVESVSHLGEIRYQGLDVRIKSLQKLFVATSKDLRVMIIKLMDRLHNMRTLSFVPAAKQKRIAEETQRVYAPLADRLGMGAIKTELDELAFKHIDPKTYDDLKKKIEETTGSVSVENIEKKMRGVLTSEGILNVNISSRIKSVYSTYIKMRYKKYSFEQIHDLIALRVVVDDTPMAYNTLGIIHAHWKPIPGTLKDYISLPKPNGYQAIHTRVIINQHILEIHILTYSMQQHAKFGIAAHFNYKEKRSGIAGIEMRWFNKLLTPQHKTKETKNALWLQRASSIHTENHTEFAEDAEADFLQERMFIFTPKGEVVDLPKKATVIDFAFAIHTDIGLRAEGAMINGKYASLRSELTNGDVVDIIAGKKPKVTKKWLERVKTAEARSRIRQFIKKNS